MRVYHCARKPQSESESTCGLPTRAPCKLSSFVSYNIFLSIEKPTLQPVPISIRPNFPKSFVPVSKSIPDRSSKSRLNRARKRRKRKLLLTFFP